MRALSASRQSLSITQRGVVFTLREVSIAGAHPEVATTRGSDTMRSSTGNGRLAHGSPGERQLQQHLGTQDRAARFYERQVLDHVNEAMERFIARQEMMFVGTSDADGNCDCTLRAGPPGFIAVLDRGHVAWPEYRGNGVLASRGNMLENPHVALLFIDFVQDTIGLHVNGRAALVADEELRRAHPDLPVDTVPGRRPEQWVVAEVEEAYIHCAKNIPRLHHHPGDRRLHRSRGKKSDYFVPEPGPSAEPACGIDPAPAPATTTTMLAGGGRALTIPPPSAAEPRRGWRRLISWGDRR
jgi:predicted pyridoxine 5'-phosphate oxidase superfamily flavin-nucleotide-binding protein